MKMYKKILALGLSGLLCLGTLGGCGGSGSSGSGSEGSESAESSTDTGTDEAADTEDTAAADEAGEEEAEKEGSDIVAGLICLHDENSTYDLNFINAFKEACEAQGLVEGETYFISTGIPEGQECYEEALNMVDRGCNFVFADSFGHEDYLIQAASENPDVQFCHATGTKAHTE
ncbi:MAG: BMP family ABC transporter substrate-binding protein, partial [Lachnospiraceae bacterium]|nr:BMP family ABC transporter substrate-binding protein [Lachnospiraceae bacterium]